MAAADQIKALIQSYGNGEDTRFFTIAMQIAAAEARKGNTNFAEELKKIIDKAKIVKQSAVGLIKTMPLNAAQKELDDLFELVHSKAKLADMVLDDMVRESLQRVLDEQANYEVLYENNLFPRRKLLLVGPPGCGKTLTAKALAAELGLPLFIIRLDGLISRYMGESISKLRLIFDAMKQYRAVYLFDEFDSIGTTRTISGDVGEIKRVLNFFLLQIEKDDSKSLIVAATNLPESLDSALFRRFDDIIRYPLPNKKEIVEFYKMALHRLPLANGFSYNKLADMSIGLSYSEMGKICMDIEKKGLIYGSKALTIEGLKTYVEQRKKPF